MCNVVETFVSVDKVLKLKAIKKSSQEVLFTLLYHLDLTFVRLRLYFSVVLFIMVQTFEFVDEDLGSRAFQWYCLLRSYLLRLRKNP